MFKWLNPNIEILTNQVKDVNRLCESLIAENKRLEMELEKAQHQASYLQEKIFDLAGVNKVQVHIDPSVMRPNEHIQIGAKTANWQKTRQTLEQQAQEAAWKKRQHDIEVSKESTIKIESLESELNINGVSNEKIQ